MQINKAMPVIQ